MILERILPFGRALLEKVIHEGDIAVDATIGNGHDTLFLSQLVGETGRVYGFDIQPEAIQTTKERLEEHGLSHRVTLFQNGHETVMNSLPPVHYGKIAGAVFNLGYLPGGDKTLVTRPRTTLSAIGQLIEMMKPGGIIVIVIYHGHREGAVERDYILRFVKQLDQNDVHVLQYQFINQENNPPFVVAIEKR
ncbi:class I SAM-dependent methyltransferase [Falsibacillus albus]|uniref:Methyltransferase domain-containing protein n=1 Tax=Falsibacillus albus TaxID=2478915 RepID=A0A3L7K4C5_9BACI|nr:class I SAM-dependent methyltransferase [Falsibacillus albus]RLQ97868.1 methyltransferase domain-containing protein [Falsibacillus albus]